MTPNEVIAAIEPVATTAGAVQNCLQSATSLARLPPDLKVYWRMAQRPLLRMGSTVAIGWPVSQVLYSETEGIDR